MKKVWIAVIAPFAIALFVWIGGEVVMHLWNWLAPLLFGWKQVTFWEALGLLALSRILFGGWGGHGGGDGTGRGPKGGRWGKMTSEEREKMRQNLCSRCGGTAAPAAEG
jgi:hypothetical protein